MNIAEPLYMSLNILSGVWSLSQFPHVSEGTTQPGALESWGVLGPLPRFQMPWGLMQGLRRP